MIKSMIVAVGKNNQIGKDNKLLWHISADLRNFKALTLGHIMIMGRKTFESIGRALPGRTTFVVSRQSDLKIEGADVFSSIDAALLEAQDRGETEVFICGGQTIYEQCLEIADKIYYSKVDYTGEADSFFPELDDEWRQTQGPKKLNKEGEPECNFSVFQR